MLRRVDDTELLVSKPIVPMTNDLYTDDSTINYPMLFDSKPIGSMLYAPITHVYTEGDAVVCEVKQWQYISQPEKVHLNVFCCVNDILPGK